MYKFQASIHEAKSRIVRLVAGFCCAITTSPSAEVGSLERRNVKEGEGLRPCRAGYNDSGSNESKSMYSPRRIFCFTFSGSGGCCGVGGEVAEAEVDCAAGCDWSGGGGGGGWGWACGDGSEMLSAAVAADGTKERREATRRSSIPCRLVSTRR